MSSRVYHLELRQFPHNLNRFNLDERELGALLAPWAREQPIDLGERRWSPHQARLTVLEGPRLAVQELSMGRGWGAAERAGEDVTERVVERARAAQAAHAAAAAASASATASAGAVGTLSDPLALGVALASLLGSEPTALLAAWREIAERAPALSPSESLALAEREIAASAASPN